MTKKENRHTIGTNLPKKKPTKINMEEPILITMLNDFIFCPVSIYFHGLYRDMERTLYQCSDQINGTAAHKTIDTGQYSTSSSILQGLDVYCEKYNLIGKIDLYNKSAKVLTERKKKVKTIYDGYVFQVYAQYFAMVEMGYEIRKLVIHSLDDNKNYYIDLPKNNPNMHTKFERTIEKIKNFDMNLFTQENKEKCNHCIYRPYCDRSC